jgi:hypothetical protein
MSGWYHIRSEDIEIDNDNSEVDLYVTHNDQGSVYAVLTFEQIAKLHAEITNE